MANALDSIDPNDLDSIDALLDEAEIESISESASGLEDEFSNSAAELEIDSIEYDSTDSLLDDLESDLTSTDLLDSESEISFESERVRAVEAPMMQKPSAPLSDDDSESFLEKRAAANAAQKNNQELTVAEMDSIKKLIIIFGSVAIALALVGIGIGIWGGVSSGKGLDETSTKMLEDIKVGTQQNTQKSSESGIVIKGIEKKMDALSFQLEQINSDLNQLEQLRKTSASVDLKNEVVGYVEPTAMPAKTMLTPVTSSTQVVMAQDPEVGEKLSKVSAQIVTTQARIADVNKRLKDMQDQYRSLLTSVKTVEKEVIASKVQKAAEKARAKAAADALEADKDASKKTGKPYQYTVPGFDYGNERDGSYP